MAEESGCGDEACIKRVVLTLAFGVTPLVALVLIFGIRAIVWILPLAFMLLTQAFNCELRIRNIVMFLLVLLFLEMFLVRGYMVTCRHMWQNQAAEYLTQKRNNFTAQSTLMTGPAAALAELVPPDTKLGHELANGTLDAALAELSTLLNAKRSLQELQADPLEISSDFVDVTPEHVQLLNHRRILLVGSTDPQLPSAAELLTTPQPLMREDVEEEFLRDYCSGNFTPRPNTPKWTPIQVLEAHTPKNAYHLFRGTCHRWTCTYTHQKKGSAFRLIMLIVIGLVFNIAYLVPKKVCWVCECLPESCRDCRDWVLTQTGIGKCSPWIVWYWIFFLTCWVVWFVTWVPNFSYVDLFSAVVNVGNAALNDAVAILYGVVTIGVLMFIYVNRRALRGFIGIENVNVVRWSIQDIIDPDWRLDDQVFQVCVWKIQARKPGVDSMGSSLMSAPLLSTVTAFVTGRQTQVSSSTGHRVQPVKFLEKQGEKNDLYIRFECGDNELRQTCVQNGILLYPDTEVIVKETLRFNLEPSRSDELLVAVCNQDVVGSTERGRVALDMDALSTEIYRVGGRYFQSSGQNEEEQHLLQGQDEIVVQWSEQWAQDVDAKLKNRGWARRDVRTIDKHRNEIHLFGRPAPDADAFPVTIMKELPLHAKQVTAMFQVDHNPRRKAEDEKAMRALGFRPFDLNRGGCIWMAFAPLPNDA